MPIPMVSVSSNRVHDVDEEEDTGQPIDRLTYSRKLLPSETEDDPIALRPGQKASPSPLRLHNHPHFDAASQSGSPNFSASLAGDGPSTQSLKKTHGVPIVINDSDNDDPIEEYAVSPPPSINATSSRRMTPSRASIKPNTVVQSVARFEGDNGKGSASYAVPHINLKAKMGVMARMKGRNMSVRIWFRAPQKRAYSRIFDFT